MESLERGVHCKGNYKTPPGCHTQCPLPNVAPSPRTLLSTSPIPDLLGDFIPSVPTSRQHFRENNEKIICRSSQRSYARMQLTGQEPWRGKCFSKDISNLAFVCSGSDTPGGRCMECGSQRRLPGQSWLPLPVSGETAASLAVYGVHEP